jgi:hypothetical protein
MPEKPADCVTLPTLLQRLSSHLDVLAAQVYDVEEAVGETISLGLLKNNGAINQLQNLDFLRQSLEDLALLTHLLQNENTLTPLGVSETISIQQKLKLNVTQNLLGDQPTTSSTREFGDVDLF